MTSMVILEGRIRGTAHSPAMSTGRAYGTVLTTDHKIIYIPGEEGHTHRCHRQLVSIGSHQIHRVLEISE